MGFYLQQDLLTLADESILDYLHHLKTKHRTPSGSFFKHTVYGLRFLFRLYNLIESLVIMPSIEHPKSCPWC
jgi:hypothetical protein